MTQLCFPIFVSGLETQGLPQLFTVAIFSHVYLTLLDVGAHWLTCQGFISPVTLEIF